MFVVKKMEQLSRSELRKKIMTILYQINVYDKNKITGIKAITSGNKLCIVTIVTWSAPSVIWAAISIAEKEKNDSYIL